MSTDPNFSREELEKLVAELEREKVRRFWNDPRPIHRAIQHAGDPPPECPEGHKLLVRFIVPWPRREERPPHLRSEPVDKVTKTKGDDPSEGRPLDIPIKDLHK
jgi:hypothetical protein